MLIRRNSRPAKLKCLCLCNGGRQTSILNEIGLRWAQRAITCEAPRRNRKGRQITRTLWARIPPALELLYVLRSAVGREVRRTKAGGIELLSKWSPLLNHSAIRASQPADK
jgi:hypothetical protein